MQTVRHFANYLRRRRAPGVWASLCTSCLATLRRGIATSTHSWQKVGPTWCSNEDDVCKAICHLSRPLKRPAKLPRIRPNAHNAGTSAERGCPNGSVSSRATRCNAEAARGAHNKSISQFGISGDFLAQHEAPCCVGLSIDLRRKRFFLQV